MRGTTARTDFPDSAHNSAQNIAYLLIEYQPIDSAAKALLKSLSH